MKSDNKKPAGFAWVLHWVLNSLQTIFSFNIYAESCCSHNPGLGVTPLSYLSLGKSPDLLGLELGESQMFKMTQKANSSNQPRLQPRVSHGLSMPGCSLAMYQLLSLDYELIHVPPFGGSVTILILQMKKPRLRGEEVTWKVKQLPSSGATLSAQTCCL